MRKKPETHEKQTRRNIPKNLLCILTLISSLLFASCNNNESIDEIAGKIIKNTEKVDNGQSTLQGLAAYNKELSKAYNDLCDAYENAQSTSKKIDILRQQAGIIQKINENNEKIKKISDKLPEQAIIIIENTAKLHPNERIDTTLRDTYLNRNHSKDVENAIEAMNK